MSELILREFHTGLGGRFATSGGTEIVAEYGDTLAEHRALTETAGVLDLSFRGRICLTGTDRTRFLHGQVTNDVKALKVGEGCYAALITAKGKMQSDLNVFCLADELLMDFEPGLTTSIRERLERFIIADDVQVVDVAPHYGLFYVNGPRAAEVVGALGIFGVLPQTDFNFVAVDDKILGQIYLMHNARLGASGFDLFVPTAAVGLMGDKLITALKGAGGRVCGFNAFEIARIEAGIPRFGIDMDESNIPLEAGLESRAISFTKGCYIGQEVISRIRTYGQVAKALRGLRLADDLKTLPAKGDKLVKGDKEVGYITSATASPGIKANIALGYVRKEVNEIGTELLVRARDAETSAKIVSLPFKGTF